MDSHELSMQFVQTSIIINFMSTQTHQNPKSIIIYIPIPQNQSVFKKGLITLSNSIRLQFAQPDLSML